MSEPLRRILVALDATQRNESALLAVARLAADLEAELAGLFIEDPELLSLAANPLSRLIPACAPADSDLDARTMERALRAQAEIARRSLAAVAERSHARWSFRIARGPMSERVLAEVQADDMIALFSEGRSIGRAHTVRGLRTVAKDAPCSVLVITAERDGPRPVTIVYEGNERVLRMGLSLARSYESPLRILAAGKTPETRAEHERAVRAWLQRRPVRAAVAPFDTVDAAHVYDALRRERARAIVLARDGALAGALDLETLMERVPGSLIIVR